MAGHTIANPDVSRKPIVPALRLLADDLRLQAQIGRSIADPDAAFTAAAIDIEAATVDHAANIIGDLLSQLKRAAKFCPNFVQLEIANSVESAERGRR